MAFVVLCLVVLALPLWAAKFTLGVVARRAGSSGARCRGGAVAAPPMSARSEGVAVGQVGPDRCIRTEAPWWTGGPANTAGVDRSG
jgi:hypothetical protein